MLLKITALFAISLILLLSSMAGAQTLKDNTDWLGKQLNELADNDDDDAQPIFSFDNCQMLMNLDTKEEGIRVKVNMNWPLREIRKVSYKPAADGKYTLFLDVPGNKVKGKMKVGIFSKSLRDKNRGSDGHTSLDLNTTDEQLMQKIQQRFEASVKQCQSSK